MNKLQKEQEQQELLHEAMKHRFGKSYKMMLKIYNELKAGQTVYLSTHNKAWLKTRFKDLNVGFEIELQETQYPQIYKMVLHEKDA